MSSDNKPTRPSDEEQKLESGVAKSTQSDHAAGAEDIKQAVANVSHDSTSDKQKDEAHTLIKETAKDAKNAEKFDPAKPSSQAKE